jgi:hypothetical protein
MAQKWGKTVLELKVKAFVVSYLSRSSLAGLVKSSDTVSYACLLNVEILGRLGQGGSNANVTPAFNFSLEHVRNGSTHDGRV